MAEVVVVMGGSVFKRCGRLDAATARQLGGQCPRLADDAHGSWFFSLGLPPGPEGKRRRLRRGGYATERAALEAMQRVGGSRAGAEALTVGVWLRRWLASRLSLRPETVRSYSGHIEDYLIPHLGRVLLADLLRSRVQAVFIQIAVAEGMAGRPVSAATLHRIHATLRR